MILVSFHKQVQVLYLNLTQKNASQIVHGAIKNLIVNVKEIKNLKMKKTMKNLNGDVKQNNVMIKNLIVGIILDNAMMKNQSVNVK
jgi:hypothetical protein